MKVVFFEAYPGFRGAQRSLASLVGELARLDVEPRIWCATEGRAAEGYRLAGLPTRVVPAPRGLAEYGGSWGRRHPLGKLRIALRDVLPYSLSLLRELRRERPALLHCNQARGLLLAAPAARLLGIPVLWHQRGSWNLSPAVGRLGHWLASGTVCVSEAVRGSLVASDPATTWVVYNGIAPATAPHRSAIDDARRELERLAADRGLERPWVVATASSAIPYKGLHHLAEALGQLLARWPELGQRLVWLALGGAEAPPSQERYRHYLHQLTDSRGLGRHVLWHGWSHQPLPWLAAADAVVLPTVEHEILHYDGETAVEVGSSEGFPRTVLEAMLVETPIIASRISGVPEQIVDGESGLLVPPSDPGALSRALGRLSQQPDLGRELARSARRVVERFDPDSTTQEIRAIYDLLLRRGPRRSPENGEE